MTAQRNESRGPDSLRLERLELTDPTLTPLLARALAEFARRLPAGSPWPKLAPERLETEQ